MSENKLINGKFTGTIRAGWVEIDDSLREELNSKVSKDYVNEKNKELEEKVNFLEGKIHDLQVQLGDVSDEIDRK